MTDNPDSDEELILRSLLRELRAGAGQRQSDLATRLGLPQSFVSKVESGERRLDIIELRRVCAALDTSLPEFAAELERRLRGGGA